MSDEQEPQKKTFKDIILSQFVIRSSYTIANLAASSVISFMAKDTIQAVLSNIFVDATLKPGAQEWLNKYLETFIAAGLMIGGEGIIHFFHDRVMLPKVIAPNIPAVQATRDCEHAAAAKAE